MHLAAASAMNGGMTISPSDSAHLRVADKLGPTDRDIIGLLQADGRMAYAEIARKLDITEKTARNHVNALLAGGIIQFTAVTDPAVLGYRASALLGIVTDPAVPASDIAEQLTLVSAIDYVVVAAGRFSLYAEAICIDRAALQRVIEDEVGKIRGIVRIESFPYLSLHYQQAHIAAAHSKHLGRPGVHPAELGETDKHIIRELSIDGRAPFQHIAATLDISEAQVRQRVKALTESGTVSVIGLINPMSLEFHAMAWIALRAAPGQSVRGLADLVATLPYCTYVAICAGGVHIMAEFVCRSDAELLQVADTELHGHAGIASVEISPYLHLYYKRLTPIRAEGPALLSPSRA
jgi:DNA-binding Lrp family transcriptional regulator